MVCSDMGAPWCSKRPCIKVFQAVGARGCGMWWWRMWVLVVVRLAAGMAGRREPRLADRGHGCALARGMWLGKGRLAACSAASLHACHTAAPHLGSALACWCAQNGQVIGTMMCPSGVNALVACNKAGQRFRTAIALCGYKVFKVEV